MARATRTTRTTQSTVPNGRTFRGASATAVLAALAALLAAPPAAAAPAAPAAPDPSRLTGLLERESTVLGGLEVIADELVRLQRDVEDAGARLRTLDYRLAEADRRIGALEARARDHRASIRERARLLDRAARGAFARLALDADGARDLFGRASAVSYVIGKQSRELGAFSSELEQLEAKKRELALIRAARAALEAELAAREAVLERGKREQLRALYRIRSSRRAQLELATELTARQRLLLAKIGRKRREISTAGGFAGVYGRLPWPVDGQVRFGFGQCVDRASRVEILRHGITIAATRRASVRAVAEGVVRVAGPIGGYGRLVLVEHGDGYFTTYGFLSEVSVAEGEKVSRGTLLGRAGLDPLTGEAALYFELRQKDRPLDPAVWLWKRPDPDR